MTAPANGLAVSAATSTSFDPSRDIWTVSRLNREVRAVLDGSFPLLWVQGELANLSQPSSGHLYFSLRDEAAQVRCAMFRPRRRLLAFQPSNGQQVLVRARVALYEPRGDYQLVCDHMEPAGEGALRLELERRKRRLAAEGLFAAAVKRPLPAFPRQIGLITSPSGAALHDLLTVLGRRFPLLPVLILPAQVQGEGAVASLIAALELAGRRGDCDLLILARGGGSLEDLMAFNDEGLARAIRAAPVPVVTGIGHEIDLSIADLAADQRGATPSAAAELCTPDATQLGRHLEALQARLAAVGRRRCSSQRQRLEAALRQLRLLHPRARLEQQAQRLDRLEQRLTTVLSQRLGAVRRQRDDLTRRLHLATPLTHVRRVTALLAALGGRLHRGAPARIEQQRARLLRLAAALEALSPLATLARGYALVTRAADTKLVRGPAEAPVGTRLSIRLQQGTLAATVDAAAASADDGASSTDD
ncbi:MAG: exodeoxyribonuclease VII large subunit [Chromatiaceae bacterium]|nr:MAG: exodeoxyribonuclease VII large subunit [Chromatiaceae bacterium]